LVALAARAADPNDGRYEEDPEVEYGLEAPPVRHDGHAPSAAVAASPTSWSK
jgi:hypothetical protein